MTSGFGAGAGLHLDMSEKPHNKGHGQCLVWAAEATPPSLPCVSQCWHLSPLLAAIPNKGSRGHILVAPGSGTPVLQGHKSMAGASSGILERGWKSPNVPKSHIQRALSPSRDGNPLWAGLGPEGRGKAQQLTLRNHWNIFFIINKWEMLLQLINRVVRGN